MLSRTLGVNPLHDAGKPRDGSVNLSELSADPAGLQRIRDLRKECSALAEEKVAIAQQAFDLVDSHLLKLDVDLTAFTEHLQRIGQMPRPGRECELCFGVDLLWWLLTIIPMRRRLLCDNCLPMPEVVDVSIFMDILN